MTVIVEQRLRFEFGPSWQQVRKYDEEAAYRAGIEKLKGKAACEECGGRLSCQICGKEPDVGSRAVDVVGRFKDRLYLIEVKDFRGYRIQNKGRIENKDLAREVARKVRDTLAGLVGAVHGREAPRWKPLVEPVLHTQPHVLLWLEEDIPPERVEKRGHPAVDIADALRGCLRWLTPRVIVVNEQQLREEELGLRVQRLSERVYKLRTLMKEQRYISRNDFCLTWPATSQVAGEELRRLCNKGILTEHRNGDRFIEGPDWEGLSSE